MMPDPVLCPDQPRDEWDAAVKTPNVSNVASAWVHDEDPHGLIPRGCEIQELCGEVLNNARIHLCTEGLS